MEIFGLACCLEAPCDWWELALLFMVRNWNGARFADWRARPFFLLVGGGGWRGFLRGFRIRSRRGRLCVQMVEEALQMDQPDATRRSSASQDNRLHRGSRRQDEFANGGAREIGPRAACSRPGQPNELWQNVRIWRQVERCKRRLGQWGCRQCRTTSLVICDFLNHGGAIVPEPPREARVIVAWQS